MKRFLLICVLLALATAELMSQTGSVTYQGRLLESGSPVTGTRTIAITIYDALNAGNVVVATQTFTNTTVTNGLYSVELTGVNATAFTADAYVEVTVGSVTLTPRLKLNYVPFALVSKGLYGATGNAFLSTDGDLTDNSDANIPTEKAVKTYVDAQIIAGGGASTDLSNLVATSINQALIPDANNSYDLGTGGKRWKDAYFAGTITGNLTGNVTGNVTGSSGSCTGNAATATSSTTATNATNAANSAITNDDATAAEMFPTWVTTASGNQALKTSSSKFHYNPSTGALSATLFLGNLSGDISGNCAGNAATATDAINFTGSLTGDVSGTMDATQVDQVGGVTAANIAAGATLANNATDGNTVSTIVRRDGSGDFSAGVITATFAGDLTGNVTGTASLATSADNAVNAAINDDVATATPVYPAWVGSNSGNQPLKVSSTALYFVPSTGVLTATTFEGDLTGNVTGNVSGSSGSCTGNAATATLATTATNATNFTGSLAGDVTGPMGTTVVAQVNGVTAVNVAAGANLANAATNLNTVSTIVRRDGSGNFSAGTITANITGNVSGSSGSCTGNAATATTATNATNAAITNDDATAAEMYLTWVSTASGNQALKTSSTNLHYNPSTGALSATEFIGNFTGDVTGDCLGNAATATAATTATDATNFTGSLAGDVTGPMGTTVVAQVNGVTAANVAAGANLANAATNLNTASTIVRRDGSGNFTAGTITTAGIVLTGKTELSVATESTDLNLDDYAAYSIIKVALADGGAMTLPSTGVVDGQILIIINDCTAATPLTSGSISIDQGKMAVLVYYGQWYAQ